MVISGVQPATINSVSKPHKIFIFIKHPVK